ncbi:DNA helicase-2 / ATP-dependent DNA helicase PcrA [Clostridium cavendishii DSM 21758]|uniref:DNA 3'-5' helicase n=1 Tax=Clostridium cavendishii DSM 21758 TaxID=1121302 RepID=A0A1M6ELI9_9CLOT|nr:ATP-dependent helicase [Clostridium cavendishii]SHI86392.1 DNA helicase-2 / ATP-dependent DNA helicase PcrA [Clostridium cavendishii DSM 21758]
MVNLDKYQLESVKSEYKNTLVIAPPGSGKTTVIINRVKYLIDVLGINEANIIVITFTKAAAQNMKERYVKGNNSSSIPFFGTFHGLCYKILSRHVGSIEIIDTSTVYRIIQKVLLTKLDEISEEKIKEVINNISLFKTSGLKSFEFEPSLDKNIFNECLEAYEGYKKERRLLDFDDLQIQCRNLFLKDSRVLEAYRRLFKYILVDEFQDCDHLQIELLKLLNYQNSLFAVGDEDQCIYSFRGSKPECMVHFSSEFEDGRKKYLTYNYRSLENIVGLSKEVISNNQSRNQKDIKAYRQGLGILRLVVPYNEALQIEDIIGKINIHKNKGDRYSDNAILYRTNVEARSIIDGLIRKKLPFKLLDKEYNFFKHFICQDLISYLKLSIDPYDRESFFKILNKPFRYIAKSAVEKLKANPYNDNLFDALINLEDIHPFQLKKLEEFKSDVASLNKMSLYGAIDFIITELGYLDYLREYSDKFKQSMDDIFEIIEEFKSAAEEFNSIINFLVHIESVEESIKQNRNKAFQDAIILSTIHGVKGMEFKNVYIVDIVNETIPHKNNLDNLEEERRLFYVGITRAVDNLYLYAPKAVRGKFKEQSPFIKEASFDTTNLNTDIGFKSGDKITHNYFGIGEIKEIRDDEIDIIFEDGMQRRFSIATILQHNLMRKIE